MKLTDLIKDNHVFFSSYRQGFFYYSIFVQTEEFIEIQDYKQDKIIQIPKSDEYQFTIPLDDLGNGTLSPKMKAIELMRWIRKALESGELIKINNEARRKTEVNFKTSERV